MVGESGCVPPFKPRFDRDAAIGLAARYAYPREPEALAAGKRIRDGDFAKQNFLTIFEFKTRGRGISRAKSNEESEIADGLRLAVDAKSRRNAIAVLRSLHGVEIPVASAIMTCIRPEEFTILDFRALESLSVEGNIHYTIDYYCCYLEYCQRLAQKWKLTLRNLDRALWQWSYQQPPQR